MTPLADKGGPGLGGVARGQDKNGLVREGGLMGYFAATRCLSTPKDGQAASMKRGRLRGRGWGTQGGGRGEGELGGGDRPPVVPSRPPATPPYPAMRSSASLGDAAGPGWG